MDTLDRDPEPWVPRTAAEWLERDPLVREGLLISLEDSLRWLEPFEFGLTFFRSWVRLLAPIRRQVWREREIAASMYSLLRERRWQETLGIRAVGVGRRA